MYIIIIYHVFQRVCEKSRELRYIVYINGDKLGPVPMKLVITICGTRNVLEWFQFFEKTHISTRIVITYIVLYYNECNASVRNGPH